MMEIFDPFGNMMPHRVPRVGRSKVCIGDRPERPDPRYHFCARAFERVRSYEKAMRVLTFMPLGAPQGMKIPFPW